MNRTLLVISLFVASLVVAQKSEAAVSNVNIFKGMVKAQNNPWDPRGKEASSPADDSGREAIPEPENSEQETNNE